MSEAKDTPRSDDFLEVSVENDDISGTSDGPSLGSPLLKGMGLDLSLAARKEDSLESEGVQEGYITVNFDLPDGSQGESVFKLGQTVEVLKSFVESEYGIPMDLQRMFLDGQPMMNPLSLLDFRETKSVDEIYIRVEGPMPDGDCKK